MNDELRDELRVMVDSAVAVIVVHLVMQLYRALGHAAGAFLWVLSALAVGFLAMPLFSEHAAWLLEYGCF